jgi:hypothetical protein
VSPAASAWRGRWLAVDVKPADTGRRTSLTLRALTESGAEIDRVVIERTASGSAADRARIAETTR